MWHALLTRLPPSVARAIPLGDTCGIPLGDMWQVLKELIENNFFRSGADLDEEQFKSVAAAEGAVPMPSLDLANVDANLPPVMQRRGSIPEIVASQHDSIAEIFAMKVMHKPEVRQIFLSSLHRARERIRKNKRLPPLGWKHRLPSCPAPSVLPAPSALPAPSSSSSQRGKVSTSSLSARGAGVRAPSGRSAAAPSAARTSSGRSPAPSPAAGRPLSGGVPAPSPAAGRPLSVRSPAPSPAAGRLPSGRSPALSPAAGRLPSGRSPAPSPAFSADNLPMQQARNVRRVDGGVSAAEPQPHSPRQHAPASPFAPPGGGMGFGVRRQAGDSPPVRASDALRKASTARGGPPSSPPSIGTVEYRRAKHGHTPARGAHSARSESPLKSQGSATSVSSPQGRRASDPSGPTTFEPSWGDPRPRQVGQTGPLDEYYRRRHGEVDGDGAVVA